MGGLEGLGAIQRMLESYKQVSKALCGKENASLEEILAVVEQVKTRLAQVERERAAAVAVMAEAAKDGGVCTGCKHSTGLDDACEAADFDCNECKVPYVQNVRSQQQLRMARRMTHCMECGKPFAQQSARHACCSTACALKWRRRNRTPERVSIAFTCAKCGRAVVTEPERGDRRSRFCCAECEKKYWRHPPREGKEVRNYTNAEVYMAYERRTNEHF